MPVRIHSSINEQLWTLEGSFPCTRSTAWLTSKRPSQMKDAAVRGMNASFATCVTLVSVIWASGWSIADLIGHKMPWAQKRCRTADTEVLTAFELLSQGGSKDRFSALWRGCWGRRGWEGGQGVALRRFLVFSLGLVVQWRNRDYIAA